MGGKKKQRPIRLYNNISSVNRFSSQANRAFRGKKKASYITVCLVIRNFVLNPRFHCYLWVWDFCCKLPYYQLTTACFFFVGWEFKQIIVQPNRPYEMARIQAAGGRVLFINGYRVRGILAMSRAIGINVCTFTSFYSMRLLLVIPSVFIYHQ